MQKTNVIIVYLQITILPVKDATNITLEMDVPPEAEASGNCGGRKNNITQQVQTVQLS